jgi:hypothetical protein
LPNDRKLLLRGARNQRCAGEGEIDFWAHQAWHEATRGRPGESSYVPSCSQHGMRWAVLGN